uniref:Polyprotein n=1 Tax=Oryza sativa subsp. japonica TaxID=39947 RepID=Q850U7_ORYSJ|nr:putative polyprotein [Oryza sativa Japonica Group]AAS01921.1 putative polyprotein [Oryza sativa Japonica Group]
MLVKVVVQRGDEPTRRNGWLARRRRSGELRATPQPGRRRGWRYRTDRGGSDVGRRSGEAAGMAGAGGVVATPLVVGEDASPVISPRNGGETGKEEAAATPGEVTAQPEGARARREVRLEVAGAEEREGRRRKRSSGGHRAKRRDVTAYISIGGNKYGFVIVDDFSRFTWVYFLHDKSEAQDVFKRFTKQAQNLYDLTIKRVQSDNGGEFKKTQVEEFLDEEGIKHEFSAPYDPPQNGIVERKNRTLIEAARAILDEYKTSDVFWAEAVSTACHAINRLYLHKILKKTSYELLSGKKPNVSYFRVFGSKCFILSKRPRLSKFSPKVDEGFLLGYDSNAHAYRVFNKTSDIVEVTRDVTFDESNGSQGVQVVVHVVGDVDPSQAIGTKAIGDIRPVETQDDQEDRDQPPSSTSNSPTSAVSAEPEVPGPIDRNFRTSPGPEVLGSTVRNLRTSGNEYVPTAQVDGIDAAGTFGAY